MSENLCYFVFQRQNRTEMSKRSILAKNGKMYNFPTQIYVVVISHLNVQYLRSIWNFSIWQICSTLKFERYALRDTKIIFETVNKLPIFCLIPELLFQYQQFWQSIHHLTSSLLNILGNPRPLAAFSSVHVGTTHTFPRKVFWCRL